MTGSDGRSAAGRGGLNQPPVTSSSGFAHTTPVDPNKPKLPGSLNVNRRLSQWLRFNADGTVEVHPGKVEIGQGILTTLGQIAADELDVDFARIRMVAASTPASPDEGVTSGSLSTQDSGSAIRHAAADARRIFLSVTSQRTGVPIESLVVRDGAFLGPQGEVGSYWQLASAELLEVDASPDARPKAIEARRQVGISTPRLDLPEKVFGVARYVHDMRLPGMLHARIIRPAARAATLMATPDAPEGVQLVRDGNFLAVLAPTEGQAEAAAARIATRAMWSVRDTLPEQAQHAQYLREAGARGERTGVLARDEAAPAVARTEKRSFFRPFLAHASIGTSCAVAQWAGDAVTIWSHTQGPYNLRADVSRTLRTTEDKVLIHHMEGAGCYGHNGADDVALEAALIARAVPGVPVRLLWSRAEELGWGPFSSAMLVDIEADVAADGTLVGWRSNIISNGHSGRPGRSPIPTLLAASQLEDAFPVVPSINPPMAGGGGAPRNGIPYYRIPKLDVQTTRLLEMPIRSSALRGLGATLNVWSIESVLDELAAAAREDPVAYRLRHLEDPRAKAVLQKAADMCGWATRTKGEGWGMGIAFARYKNTGAYAAIAAEIEAKERVYCRRLWVAGDAGEIVNPDGVVNQFEGSAIHGASVALLEQVTFDRRNITSDNWDGYRVLRFSEVPTVEVAMLNHPEAPFLGAGEASMAPTIAAIAAAIHDALGIRPHALPFTPENLA